MRPQEHHPHFKDEESEARLWSGQEGTQLQGLPASQETLPQCLSLSCPVSLPPTHSCSLPCPQSPHPVSWQLSPGPLFPTCPTNPTWIKLKPLPWVSLSQPLLVPSPKTACLPDFQLLLRTLTVPLHTHTSRIPVFHPKVPQFLAQSEQASLTFTGT